MPVIAFLSAFIGYRGEKNGWNLIAWVPALAIGAIWLITVFLIGMAWISEQPVHQGLIHNFFFWGAAIVPWWISNT